MDDLVSADALSRRAQGRKTFYFPVSSCTLSWAPIGTAGSVVSCRSEASNVSAECRWNRAVTDLAVYKCHQVVAAPEAVQSVETHDACVMTLDPAMGLARFSCDVLR